MKKVIGIGLAAVVLALTATPARAFFCRRAHDCSSTECCAPYQVTYVDKTITCYKPEWKERDVTCTINRLVTRTETVPVTCTVMVPVWHEEKRECITYTKVCKTIEKEVTKCRMVRACVVDPCTGCTRRCRVPEVTTCIVPCKVWERVPQIHEYTVKVCTLKPEEQTIQRTRVICETKPETITRKETYCVMVPYEKTIKVPVCTPAPACK
jgi:hypothetical protein